MKVLVAPDKFKGSLTAREAGDAIRAGLLRVWPDAPVDVLPVADGGEGTADALLAALGGARVERTVRGPDGRAVHGWFARLDGQPTAVVELAVASGLALAQGANDPMRATTYGTGELIAAALDDGARRVVLAVGGSATNDGGAGALSALGARFLDDRGDELEPGGAALARLATIDDRRLRSRLAGVRIEIACDVDNPLIGPQGASAVYGPQKGASPADVRALDSALARFATVVEKTTGARIAGVPGAGAAGGIAGGFLGLAGAQLVPGAILVLDVLGFDDRLAGMDLVVTGEGKLDRQTLAGKAPFAVAQAAKRHGIRVGAVAGTIDLHGDDLEKLGIEAAEALDYGAVPLAQTMARAEAFAADAAERLARSLAESPKNALPRKD